MRISNKHFSRSSALIAGLAGILGLGILAAPSKSETPGLVAPRAALPGTLVRELHSLTAAVPRSTAAQDAGQAPPAAGPAAAAPKPVELPEGDGKPIATEYCQMCHKLTNLTKAHKNLDDWKDTIQTMIDRGACIPTTRSISWRSISPRTLVPKTPLLPRMRRRLLLRRAAPATPAPARQMPRRPAQPKPVELPDGDGKAIATENCQACHKLTNLTKAHKSLDDWKETVQTMIDRGANVPPEQVDTLVQYLAKNFGPKDASAPAPAASARFATNPCAVSLHGARRNCLLVNNEFHLPIGRSGVPECFQAQLAPMLCPCENYPSSACANRSRMNVAFSSLRGSMRLARRWRYRLRVRTWPSQGQNPGSNPGIATNPEFVCHSRDGVTGAGLRTSINVVRSIHTN